MSCYEDRRTRHTGQDGEVPTGAKAIVECWRLHAFRCFWDSLDIDLVISQRRAEAKNSIVWLHAAESIVRLELEADERFFRFSESRFLRELEKLRKEKKSHPESYWNEQLGLGTTRGDLLSEEFAEVKGMQRLNRYFGVILVYSTFERFLLSIFRSAKKLKLIKNRHLLAKRFLDFRGYVGALKGVGILLTQRKREYTALDKLLKVRNTITHHGGWVHSDMAPKLRPYKFEEHQRIELEEDYFFEIEELVRNECRFIGDSYRKLVLGRETKHRER